MRLQRRMKKVAMADFVLKNAELIEKDFDNILPEPEIGFYMRGEWGTFTFNIHVEAGNESEVRDFLNNEDELKGLIFKTLKEKCTKDEQYGFTWIEVTSDKREKVETDFGTIEEMETYEERVLDEEEAKRNIKNIEQQMDIEDGEIVLKVTFDNLGA